MISAKLISVTMFRSIVYCFISNLMIHIVADLKVYFFQITDWTSIRCAQPIKRIHFHTQQHYTTFGTDISTSLCCRIFLLVIEYVIVPLDKYYQQTDRTSANCIYPTNEYTQTSLPAYSRFFFCVCTQNMRGTINQNKLTKTTKYSNQRGIYRRIDRH